MSVLTLRAIANRIEDLTSQKGLPSHVYSLSPAGELQFGVVFPIGREFELHQCLIAATEQIGPLVSQWGSLVFKPRTVLSYFANELFGSIPKSEGVFVSTNVINLRTPKETSVELPSAPSEQVQPQKWNATVLTYDIDLVLIAPSEQSTAITISPMGTAAMRFNMDSRFIQIGSLRWAWTQTRMVRTGEQLAYHDIDTRTAA